METGCSHTEEAASSTASITSGFCHQMAHIIMTTTLVTANVMLCLCYVMWSWEWCVFHKMETEKPWKGSVIVDSEQMEG